MSQSNSCNLSLHSQTVLEFPSLTPVLTSSWQNISYSVKEANSLTYPFMEMWVITGWELGMQSGFSFAALPAPQEVLCCHCSMGFSLPVPLEQTTPKGTMRPAWIALLLLGELWYDGSVVAVVEITLSFPTFKNMSCF